MKCNICGRRARSMVDMHDIGGPVLGLCSDCKGALMKKMNRLRGKRGVELETEVTRWALSRCRKIHNERIRKTRWLLWR